MIKSCGVFSLTTCFDELPHPRNFGSRVERLVLLLIEVTETLRDLRERIINAAVKLTEFLIRADLTPDEREILSLNSQARLQKDS